MANFPDILLDPERFDDMDLLTTGISKRLSLCFKYAYIASKTTEKALDTRDFITTISYLISKIPDSKMYPKFSYFKFGIIAFNALAEGYQILNNHNLTVEQKIISILKDMTKVLLFAIIFDRACYLLDTQLAVITGLGLLVTKIIESTYFSPNFKHCSCLMNTIVKNIQFGHAVNFMIDSAVKACQ